MAVIISLRSNPAPLTISLSGAPAPPFANKIYGFGKLAVDVRSFGVSAVRVYRSGVLVFDT